MREIAFKKVIGTVSKPSVMFEGVYALLSLSSSTQVILIAPNADVLSDIWGRLTDLPIDLAKSDEAVVVQKSAVRAGTLNGA
jgi:hypothetical protein